VKRVLVCALDWGLGHATRCIPVIHELRKRGSDVLIASSGDALALLKAEFPGSKFIDLPAYRPIYPEDTSMVMKIMVQTPRFASVVNKEHLIIEKAVKELKVDVVISDNRFGCWSDSVKSIFITHQRKILMPPRTWPLVSTFVNSQNRKRISKFSEVWVPDQPGSGLTKAFEADHLSPCRFVGWLSRFRSQSDNTRKYAVVALVSGPEPQRRLVHEKILTQLIQLDLKSLLVAGEPRRAYREMNGQVEIVNHLSSAELEAALRSARLVVSRSGYSTIMDLIALSQKAAFIPTPQQPEQIYFADYLKENQIAYSNDQDTFDLKQAMDESINFKGLGVYKKDDTYLSRAIDSVLQ
jgi:predicted glycosyltransferase